MGEQKANPYKPPKSVEKPTALESERIPGLWVARWFVLIVSMIGIAMALMCRPVK